MRIESFTQVAQIYQAAKPKAVNRAGKPGASDKLQISSTGYDYQLAKKAVESAPDVREDLVSGIKSRMDAGTYSVDPGSFAAKLLEKYEEMR